MAIRDVRVVSVPVSDQERAKQFYVDKLGFEVAEDRSVPGMRWVIVTPKGGTTALTLVTWFDSMPPGSVQGLVLVCDDIQVEYDSLVAEGVTFDGPPQVHPWGTETVMTDPDGNRLVLQQA